MRSSGIFNMKVDAIVDILFKNEKDLLRGYRDKGN